MYIEGMLIRFGLFELSECDSLRSMISEGFDPLHLAYTNLEIIHAISMQLTRS